MKTYLMIILIVALILHGGIMGWGMALIGVMLELGILYSFKAGNVPQIFSFFTKSKKEKDITAYVFVLLPVILLALQVLVSFWAIDYIWNLTGIMYMADVVMWMYLYQTLSKEDKKQTMEIIPISGVATVLLCLISYAIPSLKVQFWMADRLGGIFQYSNTYALFLLIGLGVMLHSILENPEKTVLSKMQKWQQILMAVCLLIGILMTGCRSVLLLGIVYGFYKAILVPKMRIPVISFVAAIIVIAAIAAFALGKSQNLGRLFTIFKYNSTLWGRLLYYKDALSMMMHHPFGLGYMGYSFIQGSEQTGVYLTRYVHNDILQVGLDLGIVAMILVVIYIIFQLVKGKQRREYKELLLLIVLASLVDWHCQYILIMMIAAMFLDNSYEGDNSAKRKPRRSLGKMTPKVKAASAIVAVAIPLSLYLLLAGYTAEKSDYKSALSIMPNNTDVLEKAMSNTSNKDEAIKMANKVLAHNKYNKVAYNTLAYAAAIDGDVSAVIENGDHVLKLNRYDTGQYVRYIMLLQDLLQNCSEDDYKLITERINELPAELASLESETSKLAYMTRDVPVFTIQ